MNVTKDTIIRDIVMNVENGAEILMASGMHCVYCPSASMESLEQACMVHGINVDEVLKKLQNA